MVFKIWKRWKKQEANLKWRRQGRRITGEWWGVSLHLTKLCFLLFLGTEFQWWMLSVLTLRNMKLSKTVLIGSVVMQENYYRQDLMYLAKTFSNARLFAWDIEDAIGSSCYLTEHAKPEKKDVKVHRNHQLLEQNHFTLRHMLVNSAKILNAKSSKNIYSFKKIGFVEILEHLNQVLNLKFTV